MQTRHSRTSRFVLATAVAAASALTVACGGVSSPSTNAQETFTGTLLPAGQNFHAFNVSKPGEYQVTVTSMSPSTIVGIGVGQLADSNGQPTCIATINQDPFSKLNKPLNGSIQKGSYCALIWDSSNSVTAAVSYTLTVAHP
jgi:hypothetical protein